MKYDLSVVVPASRVKRWEKFYDSIDKTFSGSWELILITSKQLPEALKKKSNINLIYSERAPLHKQQMGICQVKGKYITCSSDDTLFQPGFLDTSFKLLKGRDWKFYVILKFVEGPQFEYPEN